MFELLFILDYYPPHRGGIENVFEHLINGLIEKGYKITLVTSRFDKGLKEHEKIGNLTIYRTGKSRKDFFFKGFIKARKILKENKNIKIIHSSTYTTPIIASVLAFIFDKKSVTTVHEIFGNMRSMLKPRYTRWIYILYEKLMLIFPQNIYQCVSLYTLNSLRIHTNIKNEKLRLVYNGVDNDFWNINNVQKSDINERKDKYELNNKYVVSYYGHAGKTKGIDFLVKAIPQILEENPDSKLMFNIIQSKRSQTIIENIKSFQSKDEYKNRIQIFQGLDRETLRKFVACSDVIIAPSLAEGFGSVHSEVSAMGKNLITSKLAAIPEVVSGNVILMSPPSAEGICKGINDLRNGVVTPIEKKEFSREKMVNEIEIIYKNIV